VERLFFQEKRRKFDDRIIEGAVALWYIRGPALRGFSTQE
jgi:hypothetical protein